MKRTLRLLLCVLIATLVCTSCSFKAKYQIEKALESVNTQCPILISEDITMDKFIIEDNNVVMSYLVHENQIQAESLFSGLNEDAMKHFAASNENTRELFRLLDQAGMGFCARVKGDKSNYCNDLVFSPSDISRWNKEIDNGQIDSDVKSFLRSSLNAAKNACPSQFDEYTTMVDCGYENDIIYYEYTINEDDDLNLDLMLENREVFEQSIIESLTDQQDLVIRNLVTKAKEAGATFEYRYKGDISGKIITIKLDPNNL